PRSPGKLCCETRDIPPCSKLFSRSTENWVVTAVRHPPLLKASNHGRLSWCGAERARSVVYRKKARDTERHKFPATARDSKVLSLADAQEGCSYPKQRTG
ncbi:unnamed protein product, partial [Ectocarpus sp. 8 AP-2014]